VEARAAPTPSDNPNTAIQYPIITQKFKFKHLILEIIDNNGIYFSQRFLIVMGEKHM
jgi:hypothetical protein